MSENFSKEKVICHVRANMQTLALKEVIAGCNEKGKLRKTYDPFSQRVFN